MPDFPAPGARPGRPGTPSRRAVLLVGVGGLAVLTGACAGGTIDPGPGEPPPLAPDVSVAAAALAGIRDTSTAVSSTMARHRAIRSRLAPLLAMHRAHEASLADAVPDRAETSTSPAPYSVPGGRDAALRALAAREQQLHGDLDDLAVRAESGDFARLLASMGAGIGQQLAGWPA